MPSRQHCSHAIVKSSAEWSRDRSWSTKRNSGHVSTYASLSVYRHIHICLLRQCAICKRLAAQRPCPVRKRFSIDHVRRLRSKPGSRTVGSGMRWLLVTEADCQSALQLDTTSVGAKSDHIGFLDSKRGDGLLKKSWYTGQSGWASTTCNSLSQAAYRRIFGGVMLLSTGSQATCVGRRVLDISRMVEFSCASTRPVWADLDQSGQQYSAAE